MQINWLRKIGNKADHNAFVDLCEFKQQLICCYREAENHISADGKICILTLNTEGNILYSSRIAIPNTDLRDPKISITPDGNILLIAYARQAATVNRPKSSRNLTWLSKTGNSWSIAKEFADKGWWLWRVRWHKDEAYGFAYNRKKTRFTCILVTLEKTSSYINLLR